MQRAKVVDNALPNGDFQDSSTQAALDGTILRAGFQNDNFNNLFELVENSGQTLVDDDHSQISKAVVKQSLAGYYKDVGVINAIQLDNSGIDEETLFDGMMIVFAPKYTNTGASTIKIKSLATKPLKYKGADLVNGFLKTTCKYIAVYDATNSWFNTENINTWSEPITLTIGGDATGDTTIDGSANKTITLNVLDSEKIGGIPAFQATGASAGSTTQDPNITTDEYIITNHVNSPNSTFYWHIRTQFAVNKTALANRMQIAVQYNGGISLYVRSNYVGVWTDWEKIIGESDSQALHPTDALRLVGNILSLYKGDGTSESVTISQPTSVGAVGTYAFMRFATSGSGTPGSTASGSSLRYTDNLESAGATATGTWQCMGDTGGVGTRATVWLKIIEG